MALDFSGTGLIRSAMDIERSGEAFYDVMAAIVKNAVGEAKDLILIYEQLRDNLHGVLKPVVESIPMEEQKHLIMLSGVKKMVSL